MELQSEPDFIIEDISERKTIPGDELGFGKQFTDRMLVTKFDGTWSRPVIKAFSSLDLTPAALVFHYGQAIFEGMKAYRQPDGEINLFRPYDNARRFNKSARRMVMPEYDTDMFVNGIKTLVDLEQRWVPESRGSSLYIRPIMIASEEVLGVRAASEYLFAVILSPSGPYFATGFNPTKIKVEENYVRAFEGGTGDVKFAGNYAASLIASKQAKAEGYSQVLWLDAKESRYIEEVGAMNIAFVINDEIYSPKPRGTILDGITRRSVKTLASDLGIEFNEDRITIDHVKDQIEAGNLSEIFGIGTAAVISPVGTLNYRNRDYLINDNQVGPVARQLYDKLTGIQYGLEDDVHDWMVPVAKATTTS